MARSFILIFADGVPITECDWKGIWCTLKMVRDKERGRRGEEKRQRKMDLTIVTGADMDVFRSDGNFLEIFIRSLSLFTKLI